MKSDVRAGAVSSQVSVPDEASHTPIIQRVFPQAFHNRFSFFLLSYLGLTEHVHKGSCPRDPGKGIFKDVPSIMKFQKAGITSRNIIQNSCMEKQKWWGGSKRKKWDHESREKKGGVKAFKTNFADLTMTNPVPETITTDRHESGTNIISNEHHKPGNFCKRDLKLYIYKLYIA